MRDAVAMLLFVLLIMMFGAWGCNPNGLKVTLDGTEHYIKLF